MSLGNKILELRKKEGYSQEELGEKIGVTRQTISNWELDETAPDPEQLKLLSKELKISIDELLSNDINNVLVNKVNSTEKLSKLILTFLKCGAVVLVIFVIFIIVSLIRLTSSMKKSSAEFNSINYYCKIGETNYEIEFDSNKYFNCKNCSNEMNNEIKNLIDFNNINDSVDKVNNYFNSHNGSCE